MVNGGEETQSAWRETKRRESAGCNERSEKVRDRNREVKSYSGNDVVAMETLSSIRLFHRCLVGIFKQPCSLVGSLEQKAIDWLTYVNVKGRAIASCHPPRVVLSLPSVFPSDCS